MKIAPTNAAKSKNPRQRAASEQYGTSAAGGCPVTRRFFFQIMKSISSSWICTVTVGRDFLSFNRKKGNCWVETIRGMGMLPMSCWIGQTLKCHSHQLINNDGLTRCRRSWTRCSQPPWIGYFEVNCEPADFTSAFILHPFPMPAILDMPSKENCDFHLFLQILQILLILSKLILS